MFEKELAEIPSEGTKLEDLMEEEGEKTSTESPTEKKEESEEEEKEEEKIPFHKHPRFKSLVNERNQLKEELEGLREEMDSKFSEITESRSEESNQPEWFTELYGENETAWKKYQAYDKQTREELKREMKEEFEQEREREKKQKEESVTKWENWIDKQVETLADEGLKFDKDELIKVMSDFKPSDDQGNLDFRRGYEIMEIMKKKDTSIVEKSNARKEIMDEGKNSKAEPADKKWFTPADMRGRGWGG